MSEIRVVQHIEDGKGHIIEEITAVISDEQLYQEQLTLEFNDVHTQAILALKNWNSLTPAQKDTILKNLVKWALWKEGWLKLSVL